MLPLGPMIEPEAGLLSVRGNVSENGMPRFFKRLSEGVFDEEDLVERTKELYQFLSDASVEYGFDRSEVIALGYSNGANIAASMLYHFSDAFKSAILHHPMVPLRNRSLQDLNGVAVFIGAGENDPICTPGESKELAAALEQAGASVKLHWERNGHQLTEPEVRAAANWYSKN